jgi:uncharacterized protein YlxW (UPF0749 family)
MNSGELMVVLIVAIVMIASIFKTRSRFRDRDDANPAASGENQRLREEVQQLKERLKVLERITVEKENSLAKEIESLRDR